MGIIIAILLGGLAGYLAGLIMKTNLGVLGNIIVGLIGAAIANFAIAPFLGVSSDLTKLNLASFLVAVLGSVVLLGIVRLIQGRQIR